MKSNCVLLYYIRKLFFIGLLFLLIIGNSNQSVNELHKETIQFENLLTNEEKIKKDAEMHFLEKEFEKSSEGKFNGQKPKLPDMPDKMPDTVRFMEKALANAYGLAYKEAFGTHKESESYFGIGDSKLNSLNSLNDNPNTGPPIDNPITSPPHEPFSNKESDSYLGIGDNKKNSLNDNPNTGPPNEPFSKFPQDKRRIEKTLSSETYPGEETVPVLNANSNSVYSINFLWYHKTYPASNAIVGYNYYCSSGNHGANDIITWEAEFSEVKRIHGINLVWAYAPERYAIEFAGDDGKWKLLIDWRGAIQNKKAYWWSSIVSALKSASKSFPLRITFPSATFAIKVRILMKGPTNFYFGLYKVDFFSKNWKVLIKAPVGATSELCWTVNNIAPVSNSNLKVMDCLVSIQYTENREFFTLTPNLELIHFVSNKCVVTNEHRSIYLQSCDWARQKADGRNKWKFMADGTIRNKYNVDECAYYMPPDGINFAKGAKIEVSSESADNFHAGRYSTDGNTETFWMSNPGTERVTYTVYFSKWVSGDNLVIDWKYIPLMYDIYTFSLEKGWTHFVKVSNNSSSKSIFSLAQYNFKAIQLRLTKSSKTLGGQMVYGIKSFLVSDSSFLLGIKKCDDLEDAKKVWLVDEQNYSVIEKKKDYVKEENTINKTYLKLRKVFALVSHEIFTIPKLKEKAESLDKELKEAELKIKELLASVKKFRLELSKKNKTFQELLEDYKLEFFEPYKPQPPNANKKDDGKKRVSRPMKDGKILSIDSQTTVMGSTKTKPALDCYNVKHLYNYKKSGYYWIKPDCSPKPMRVFCDFSIIGKGLSILLWNNGQIKKNQIQNKDFSTEKKIRYECAKLGLYPINIKNENYITRITQLATVLGWDLDEKESFIPIGFDYTCAQGQGLVCARDWKSFNDIETIPIKKYFPSKDSIFASIVKSVKATIFKFDTIGIGMETDGKPHYDTLKTSKISGILCSTNETDFPKASDGDMTLTCSETITSSSKIEKTIGSELEFVCPNDCFGKTAKVYGQNIYAEDSSICLAAIHAGAMKKEGGRMKIKILGPNALYMSSKANEIKSEKWIMMTSHSFAVMPAKDRCPVDLFANESEQDAVGNAKKTSSFLELGLKERELSELETLALMEMRKNYDPNPLAGLPNPLQALKDKNKMQEEMDKQLKHNEEKLAQDKEVQKMEETNEKLKMENAKLNTQNEISKLQGLGDKLKSGMPSLPGMPGMPSLPGMPGFGGVKWPSLEYKSLLDATVKKAEEMKKSLDPNSSPSIKAAEEAAKPVSNIPIPGKINVDPTDHTIPAKASFNANGELASLDTDQLIKKLLKYRQREYQDIEFIKKYGISLVALIDKLKAMMAFSIYPSLLSNVSLMKRSNSIEATFLKVNLIIAKIKQLCEWRHANTKKTTAALQDKINKMQATLPFKVIMRVAEKMPDVEASFVIYDNKASSEFPSQWKYTTFDLNGKANALVQNSKIKGREVRYGTMNIIKNKTYYDFEFTCEIMMSEEGGSGGLIFRFKDVFNYYAFEINTNKKSKQLVKYRYGKRYVIGDVQDGGIVLNNWFKVLIQMKQNSIKIRMGDTAAYTFKDIPVAFSTKDNYLSSGGAGFFTNGLAKFHATDFQIVGLPCQQPWIRIDREYINPKSNIYYEDFEVSWAKKYKNIHPSTIKGGLPFWTFKNFMFGRNKIVYQGFNTLDVGLYNEPSMSISKIAYMKNECVFKLQFMAVSEGTVGMVFKYKDPDNYYLFEIGGGSDIKNRFFLLRKKINGKFHIISKHYTLFDLPNMTFVGYESGIWYQAIITIKNLKKIAIEMAIIGVTRPMTVFSVDDNDLNYGYIGFSTNGTKAAFTEIDLRPIPIPLCLKETNTLLPQDILKDACINEDIQKRKKFSPFSRKAAPKDGGFSSGKNTTPIKIPTKKSQADKAITWKPCIITKTQEERILYCDKTFLISAQAQKKCANHFCEDCCMRNTPKDHNLYLYSCKKECDKNSAPTPNNIQPEWWPICIKPPNTHNIYRQCLQQWPVNEVYEIGRCKRDQCRLCCAIFDSTLFKITTIESNDLCFKQCEKSFGDYRNLKKNY